MLGVDITKIDNCVKICSLRDTTGTLSGLRILATLPNRKIGFVFFLVFVVKSKCWAEKYKWFSRSHFLPVLLCDVVYKVLEVIDFAAQKEL